MLGHIICIICRLLAIRSRSLSSFLPFGGFFANVTDSGVTFYGIYVGRIGRRDLSHILHTLLTHTKQKQTKMGVNDRFFKRANGCVIKTPRWASCNRDICMLQKVVLIERVR